MIANAGTDAEVAVAAAQAGAACCAPCSVALARYDKSDGDFATVADLEAEKAVTEVVRTARPADAITGEESGSTGADGAERRWLVDPLCGTLNYAARSMLAAVNVALRGDWHHRRRVGRPILRRDLLGRRRPRLSAQRRRGRDAGPLPGTQLVDVNLTRRSRTRQASGQ